MAHVFEGTWVFIGLESQIPKPHDFITAYLGRQPVILMRDAQGQIGCFLNTCRHRGTIVCPFMRGNQPIHVCRYHGWTYDSAGRNVGVAQKRDGQYPQSFDAEDHDLARVPRLESYRGLLFASLSPDVKPLQDHLGEARTFLDLVIDQGRNGLEFVPGEVSYTFDGNWKLQFENGLDYYHFASTHSSYADLLKVRAQSGVGPKAVSYEAADEQEGQGSFSFENGHSVMWSIRKQGRIYRRPLTENAEHFEEVVNRVDNTRVKWMLRQRNLTIFPNLQIIDISSLQLRIWRPLAVDRTEMISHCLAPVGESAEARRLRIRQYEDFFNPTGLATSDDNVMYEYCQTGYEAQTDGWTQGYARGMGGPIIDRNRYAEDLGIHTAGWAYGPLTFGDETCFHAGYREWRRLIERGLAAQSSGRTRA